jgi:uncharacterized protein YjiS (DUF1127 family)
MERFLVIRTLSGYEIRRERPGLLARLAASWRARRQDLELAALDPRMLRDIGLHDLAFRVAERQRLEAYWAGLC